MKKNGPFTFHADDNVVEGPRAPWCDVVDLLQAPWGTNADTAVSIAIAPRRMGSCPDGYTYLPGRIVENYAASCDKTAEKNWCILPSWEAKAFCDASADCWGISETSDAGWNSAYPKSVMVGSYSSDGNSAWDTCKKGR